MSSRPGRRKRGRAVEVRAAHHGLARQWSLVTQPIGSVPQVQMEARVRRRRLLVRLSLPLAVGLPLALSTAPAYASPADFLDQVITASGDAGGRCSGNAPSGSPWGGGPAVEFTPGRSGAISRVVLDLYVHNEDGGTDNAEPAIVSIRSDQGDYPGNTALAQVTVPASTILAAPPATVIGWHTVEVDFPTPAGVEGGWQYWVTLLTADGPVRTTHCLRMGFSSTPQGMFSVTTYNGAYMGGNLVHEPGRAVPMTDYLTYSPTQITAYPYRRQIATSSENDGYLAYLTAPDGEGFGGQKVVFSSGGKVMCTAVTQPGGRAECPPSTLPPVRDYTVTYAGSGLLRPSSGSAPFLIVTTTDLNTPVGSASATATF